MSQPDLLPDVSVERTTDLDIDVEQLWELISTSEGWSSWLVDEASVHVAPAATGSAIDDGVARDVRIDSVAARRSVSFTWWDRDDPTSISYVQLGIVELPHGRSQLHITERFVGSTTRADAVSWDVRLISLWLSIVQAAVTA
jgi:uncharacterized protein YndB with AHSA1/START domain